MYSGLIIKLPRKNLKEYLELTMNIMESDNIKNINKIDLRQHNQIIIDG